MGAADLKLLWRGALLGLALSQTTGCMLLFWTCSDCDGCDEPPADHYGVFTVDSEPEERDPVLGRGLPDHVARLASAKVDASTVGALTIRYESESGPVTLNFVQKLPPTEFRIEGAGGLGGVGGPELAQVPVQAEVPEPLPPAGPLATLDEICESGGTYPAEALEAVGTIVDNLTFIEAAGFAHASCDDSATAGRMSILEVGTTALHSVSVRAPVPVGLVLHRIEAGSCSPVSPCLTSELSPEGAYEVGLSSTLAPGRYQIIVTTSAAVTDDETLELTLRR